jgi:hypothetical protein
VKKVVAKKVIEKGVEKLSNKQQAWVLDLNHLTK